MNLKEQLEIIRGEPIQVFDGDPMDIPCIETSDAKKLCKNPVVSVHMITYNHEPYIRQAIEGVMMQKTDFEFELIIGDDASQDKTREICFEYQKKYPDKIRVLWWHENVSKLGGNGRRVAARCRGEFIAFCEGDDYWTDSLKLQKQVEYIKTSKSVMCVANSEWHMPNGEVTYDIYKQERSLLSIEDMIKHYFHTTTYLIDRQVYENCRNHYKEMIFWYDCVLSVCMSTMGTVCFLPDVMSVYNWTGEGISGSPGSKKRDRMLALQFVQFSYCSNQYVSKVYAFTAIQFIFYKIIFATLGDAYKYAKPMRRMMWKVARQVCWNHYGRCGNIRLLSRYYYMLLRTKIKFFCVHYPCIGRWLRKIRSLCIKSS